MKFNIDQAIKEKGMCTHQKIRCSECEIGKIYKIFYPLINTDILCSQQIVYEIAKILKDK